MWSCEPRFAVILLNYIYKHLLDSFCTQVIDKSPSRTPIAKSLSFRLLLISHFASYPALFLGDHYDEQQPKSQSRSVHHQHLLFWIFKTVCLPLTCLAEPRAKVPPSRGRTDGTDVGPFSSIQFRCGTLPHFHWLNFTFAQFNFTHIFNSIAFIFVLYK